MHKNITLSLYVEMLITIRQKKSYFYSNNAKQASVLTNFAIASLT